MSVQPVNPESLTQATAEPPVAWVTGAARGIGAAIARRLAQDGCAVWVLDRDADAAQAMADTLVGEGWSAQACGLDVTDRPAVAAALARSSRVDIVVNNAGMASPLLPLAELSTEALTRMLAVNVQGTFIVAQEAARRLQAGGRIINIASRGYLGGAGSAHYVASKTAVVALTRAMAVELRWRGIRVNAVAPGMVETRMIEDFTPEMRAALVKREPSGAPLAPEAIADVVAFLASPAARAVQGQVLLVDDGKSIGVPVL